MRAKLPYKKKRKRVGCGNGSGHGKTSCRGQKGQKSRSGVSFRGGFEGGQNPLYRRLPKRGFNRNRFRSEVIAVNVNRLSELQNEVTAEVLFEKGIIKNAEATIKILGSGDLKNALTVKAHQFSRSAKEKIEKAGGQAIVLETKPKQEEPKK